MEKVLLRKFTTLEDTIRFTKLLDEYDISYEVIDTTATYTNIYLSNTGVNMEFRVNVLACDVQRAEEMIKTEAYKDFENSDESHYLYTFSNDDLRNLIRNSDEWSESDYLLAVQILNQRGEPISDQEIQKLRNARMIELREPAKLSSASLWVMYTLGVLFFIYGICAGYLVWTTKKKLPDGTSVYNYDSTSRNHAKRIFFLAVLTAIITCIARIKRII